MKRKLIHCVFILAVLVSACKKNAAVDEVPQPDLPTVNSSDKLRTEFSKVLAKAMANSSVRELIKKEALNKFDNDYDVLYQLVKDQKLSSGQSFEELLVSTVPSTSIFNGLGDKLPLLTILVPELPGFSAEKWNISKEIPLVAVVNNDYDEKKRTKLEAFDANGNMIELSSDKDPGRPVIVVRENERLMAIGKNVRVADSKGNYVFSNGSNSFYFKDDLFNKKKTPKLESASFITTPNQIDVRLKDAYALGAASQRDYVYYGILNPQDQGPLNSNYVECLNDFIVNDKNALNYLFEDPTSDWSDGAFEFQMDILFFNGISGLSKISKAFSISRSSLITPATGGNPGDSNMLWYHFPIPITIATWDMKAHGDTWKFVVNEIDPGSVVTTTHTSTSKFGTNFSLTGQIFEKVGIGFGTSTETTGTNTTTVQTTTGSDFCGEGVVSFVNPIITGYLTLGPGFYVLPPVNTGMVSFAIYPRHL